MEAASKEKKIHLVKTVNMGKIQQFTKKVFLDQHYLDDPPQVSSALICRDEKEERRGMREERRRDERREEKGKDGERGEERKRGEGRGRDIFSIILGGGVKRGTSWYNINK